MNSLFEINDDGLIDIRDERIKLIPEFRAVLKMKDGQKWFSYVHGYADHLSVYASVRNDDERSLQLLRDIFNGKLPIPEKVIVAISRYGELQTNPTKRMVRAMNSQLEKAITELEALQMKGESDITKLLAMGDKLIKMQMNVSQHEERMGVLTSKKHEENLREGLSIFERSLRSAVRN